MKSPERMAVARAVLPVVWLLLVAMASGCGRQPIPLSSPPKPGQAEALVIVMQAYGLREAPPILWVEGEQLNCDEGLGYLHDGVCVSGTYHVEDEYIRLAWPPYAKDVRDVALELSHEAAHYTAPWVDNRHEHAWWHKGGLVEQVADVVRGMR